MSETKWTPGPWKVTYKAGDFDECVGVSMASHQRNPNHHRAAHLWHSDCEPDCSETVANARLIAAAPELYEALDALVAIHECCDETGYVDGEGFVDVEAAVEKARAALAKARGEP